MKKRLDPQIGDSVKIIYNGGYYSHFPEVAQALGLINYGNNQIGSGESHNQIGKVVAKTIHPIEKDRTMYGIVFSGDRQAIFSNKVSRECFEIVKRKGLLPDDLFTL